jgi:hypothetical protein
MLRLAVLIALTALTLIGSPLVAAAGPSLNWGSHVNPARCPTDQGYRYLEINVTRKVEGADAFTCYQRVPGAALELGTNWATREFNQHIQVWKVGVIVDPPDPPTVGAERFCALVRYQGSFTTLEGPSPNPSPSPAGSHVISDGIDGSFEGGYLLVFNADELASPAFPSRGHIGTVAGPVDLYDWLSFYFTNPGLDDLQWWGWVHHGGHNGAWVNSIDGNEGDIVD